MKIRLRLYIGLLVTSEFLQFEKDIEIGFIPTVGMSLASLEEDVVVCIKEGPDFYNMDKDILYMDCELKSHDEVSFLEYIERFKDTRWKYINGVESNYKEED